MLRQQVETTPFGKYQLIDRLATGGMAEIYRARLTGPAGVTKQVVIKKILSHYAKNKSFVSMFVNEAKIVVGLSHGNIAQVFDFGEIDGEYFLAMEYVHGQPLSKVLKRIRAMELPFLPVPFAVLITLEMCKGLHYAHTRLEESGKPLGIVHRDISPQNVMISYEGQVKLVDFGIAKARTRFAEETEAGSVKGKFVYFSPEQARTEALDGRSDVFATGIVLYEMLCGRLPFDGKMIEVLEKITSGDFPSPRELNPDITPELEYIILNAMAVDKRRRYATAESFQEALAAYLYTHAPTFSTGSLAHLMQYLFEADLVAEGRPVMLPREFIEQIPKWRKGQPAWTGISMPSAKLPARRSKVAERLVFLGLPLVAMAGGALVVIGVGHYSTFSVQLTSDPPGARVTVDGVPAEAVTPVFISELSARTVHRIEVTKEGLAPWSRQIQPSGGSSVALHADLKPHDPTVAALNARPGSAANEAPPRLALGQHAFIVPPSTAARLRIDPRKRYRIWTEGLLAVGPKLMVDEAVFFLETTDAVPQGERSGIVSSSPRMLPQASLLYAFVIDGSPADNSGVMRLFVQESASGAVQTVTLDGKQHTVAIPEGQALSLTGLDPAQVYELTVREVTPAPLAPAAIGPGKGAVRTVAAFQQPTLPSPQSTRVRPPHVMVEVGKPTEITGTRYLHLSVLDDAREDNTGEFAVELRVLPNPAGPNRK